MVTEREAIERARRAAADWVAALGPQRVQAVWLYGSVARGEYVPGVSDVNLLVLWDRVAPEDLARWAPRLRAWLREGGTLPRLFGAEEWARAVDVFPLEHLEIHAAHVVLHGPPPPPPRVDPEALRLELEREWATKRLQLRLHLATVADRSEALGHLLRRAAPTLAALLRGLLHLVDPAAVPRTAEDTFARAAERFGFDTTPLVAVWRRRAEARWRPTPDDPVIRGVLALLDRATELVDRGLAPTTDASSPENAEP